MASCQPNESWRVKIVSIPASITVDQLSNAVSVPSARIIIPPNQTAGPRYAWVGEFDETSAKEFETRWSGASIFGSTIKCVSSITKPHVFPRKGAQTHTDEESSPNKTKFQSTFVTRPGSSQEKKPHVFPRKGTQTHTNEESPSDTIRPQSAFVTRPESAQETQKTRSSSKSVVRKPQPKLPDKDRPLCHYANKGKCREKSNECKYRHQRCEYFNACFKPDCKLAHGRARSLSNSSTDSTRSASSMGSTNAKAKKCSSGAKCFNIDCDFEHPDGWNPCPDGVNCKIYECTANHPYKRPGPCRDSDRCKNNKCKFLHPKTRAEQCPLRAKCLDWNCKKLHPLFRARRCPDEEKCTNLSCLCLHPPQRSKLLCPSGADCHDLSCGLNHPPERPPVCDEPNSCPNPSCTRLHSSDWNPIVDDDSDSSDEEPTPALPSAGNTAVVRKKKVKGKDKSKNTKKKSLKSSEQRMKDWEKAGLPILACRNEFCSRLRNERILIVRAETGSGKSTQLPQYAAEQFGALVVCTQPRVVAALSLARRVAEEYDGTSVGESVGYKAGHGNQTIGSHIMFMTDAALIRESQRDPQLKHINVLIIDEAHERSLNTDIVLGIAKLLLTQRPNDFYVVIASATIDPTRFLQFFGRPTNNSLLVGGRVFPVTSSNKPPPEKCPDQKLIETHVVPTVLELYPRHQGHTLVFLPGQGEIERALRIFRSKTPDDCCALPLYGSQTPEDQEKVIKFNEKNKRMIVFCTNVAETSLTIPDVRLVIDSGLAKEARYDVKRRLTVIETVRISRSSADQRKGRAGRTAAGHCVRLYADTELVRANIEPEILRSSLDLVLLQIIRLNLDPKTFPFMDQPDMTIINASIDLLTNLKCIENQTITKQGELFTELGLDPRFSAFIVNIYTVYKSLLDVVVGIVAILSAPGTIFFMGGGKEEARMRVALQAHDFKSDLIHLYSVYNEWKNAGTKQTQGNCQQCKKQVKWCICRIKYSNEKNLNNKILQFVDTSCSSIIKQIKKTRWMEPGNEMPGNLMEIISQQLARLFPEQCGYLLVPQLPTEGVRLTSTDVRANITDTSVFMQKLHTDSNQDLYQYFVSMTITQLPSGSYIIEKLHPIPRSLSPIQSTIKILKTMDNISSYVFQELKQKLYSSQSNPSTKWMVCQYERANCRFILWGVESEKATINSIVDQLYRDVLKKHYDKDELLECGPIKGSFQSGLVCTHINKMTNALRLDLQNLPTLKPNEVKDWLNKTAGIEWNEIKEHNFYTVKNEGDKKEEKKNLSIVFKNESVFQRVKDKIPSYHLCESNGNHRSGERERWGRELTIETPNNITEQDIINRYGNDAIIKCVQLNQNKKSNVESSLKLSNLPKTTDENILRECLKSANGPKPTYVHVGQGKNDTSQTIWAKVKFSTEEQRNQAATIYDIKLCQSSFPIMISGTNGLRQKMVQTKVEKDNDIPTPNQDQSLQKNIFRVTLTSREATVRIFTSQSTSDWTVDSCATITILRTDLYPDFAQTLQGICAKFEVKVKTKDIRDNGKCLTFNHGSPQKTSLAAAMLAQSFMPMNIKSTTTRQKELFEELHETGKIQQWANELGLNINKNKFNTNIEVRGPQIAQGLFMRRIADYSDDFDKRFREHELNATVAGFFGPKKSALGKLQQIDSKWSSKLCSVSFISRTSTIIIRGKPKVVIKDLNTCDNEVFQLLDGLTATPDDDDDDDDDEDEEQETDEDNVPNFKEIRQERRCVFCKQKSSTSTSQFRICGHAYCRCAAQALGVSNRFPLQCKDCQTNIHIRDIEDIFNNNKQLYTHLLKNSIQEYLIKNAQQDDRIFCPNDECDGLIKRNNDYQTCLTCGRNVCSKCQVIDDDLHFGRTCAQLIDERKRHEFLPQLIAAARKFVDENWPVDASLRPIGRIDENPYLAKQYKSLRRFYEGIKALGHSFPPDLSKGFFAYHGCAYQAIDPICQDGFDPKRRAGQAYGRGEYFGVTATVSHGYAQKGGAQAGFSQMLISYLLRCPQTTTHGTFCYVVDNPIDWTYAFNVPVLVITYGQQSVAQRTPFPNTISNYVDTGPSWKSPFRWHWRQDNGNFEPCTDTINELLEKDYEQWKFHRGAPTVVTPPITRYLDDVPQTYKIDFQNNRQINTKTSYQRVIDRRPSERPLDNLNWFYRNENGIWTRFETLVQTVIEKAFQSYRLGQAPSIANIHFPGRPETYELNFLTGKQKNNTTSMIRDIKRE